MEAFLVVLDLLHVIIVIYELWKTRTDNRTDEISEEASGECSWVSIIVTRSELYLKWYAFNILLWNTALALKSSFYRISAILPAGLQ